MRLNQEANSGQKHRGYWLGVSATSTKTVGSHGETPTQKRATTHVNHARSWVWELRGDTNSRKLRTSLQTQWYNCCSCNRFSRGALMLTHFCEDLVLRELVIQVVCLTPPSPKTRLILESDRRGGFCVSRKSPSLICLSL